MTDQKQIKVAVDIIVERDGKILLGKRLNAVGAGDYGVPGGHLEFGESLHAGAKRELKEETGLMPDDLKFISVIGQPSTVTPQHYIHFLFLCSKFEGEPVLTEPDRCEGWEWFDPHNLPENLFVSHKALITAYLDKKVLID